MMPLPSVTKLCFNSNCRQVLDRSRKGWRRRTGEFADLCDRCASAYEEGKFCESFHLNASGWRCCESCGKQIHCGCIVSFHTFVLLDAGGIECMACARTSFILTPNPAWPPPTLHLPGLPDKTRDHSVKSWSSIAGAGPLPWRQAPSSFNNNTVAQVELNPKISPEVDVAGGIDRLYARERFSACSLDNKKNKDSERLVNGSLKTSALETTESEVSGSKCERQPTTYANVGQQLDFPNNGPPAHISPILNPPPKTDIVDQNKISGAQGQRAIPPPGTDKHFPISVGVDSASEARTHNGKPRGDARVRKYLPKITDQELQEISGDSNTVITPLFEKILSASDAGRIGRLVLPKKCAEAYLPAISNPEGIPLMMQDLKGREWIFQFRFWPNNNSRMYVLEGVTPCIHSMQLVAGDTITFSRLEPEGKLVMGCRKTSTSPRDQQNTDTVNTGNGVSTHRDAIFKASKPVEVVSAHLNVKDNPTSASLLTINQTNTVDPSSRWSEADKSKYIAKEPFFQSKRKNSTLGTRSKRPRIGNDQIIELKLTLGEAQRLFRPPSNIAPKILVIEGCEIAEFEEPPIIGRPTILATDDVGTFQWAQCEDCFKWRKVPGDILFPSRWTCSENLWDPERSLCSAAPELPPEELDDLLITAGANKVKAGKEATDSVDATDGLDELANLAINEEGDFRSSSFQTTTKHPRHRPGCTCIVCIQPPSGKGPKHKPTCSCNVCSTVKRRFHTVMSRRGKKQYGKEAESAPQKLQQPEQLIDVDTRLRNDTGKCSQSHDVVTDDSMGHDIYQKKLSLSPFTGHIDLNMQPEREEDLSAVSDSGGMMRLLQFAKERYLEQQKSSTTEANRNSLVSPAGVGVGNSSNNVPLDSHDDNKELDPPLAISAITS